MRLTILGSGSPEAHARRASSGYLLEVGAGDAERVELPDRRATDLLEACSAVSNGVAQRDRVRFEISPDLFSDQIGSFGLNDRGLELPGVACAALKFCGEFFREPPAGEIWKHDHELDSWVVRERTKLRDMGGVKV